MKEQFVSYELAKVLKEKGFNEPCIAGFNDKQILCGFSSFTTYLMNGETYDSKHLFDYVVIAPLWQQVIDWLRVKYEIEIVISGITVYGNRKYSVCLYYNDDGIMTDHSLLLFNKKTGEYKGYQTFTYQEATEVGIAEALSLI